MSIEGFDPEALQEPSILEEFDERTSKEGKPLIVRDPIDGAIRPHVIRSSGGKGWVRHDPEAQYLEFRVEDDKKVLLPANLEQIKQWHRDWMDWALTKDAPAKSQEALVQEKEAIALGAVEGNSELLLQTLAQAGVIDSKTDHLSVSTEGKQKIVVCNGNLLGLGKDNLGVLDALVSLKEQGVDVRFLAAMPELQTLNFLEHYRRMLTVGGSELQNWVDSGSEWNDVVGRAFVYEIIDKYKLPQNYADGVEKLCQLLTQEKYLALFSSFQITETIGTVLYTPFPVSKRLAAFMGKKGKEGLNDLLHKSKKKNDLFEDGKLHKIFQKEKSESLEEEDILPLASLGIRTIVHCSDKKNYPEVKAERDQSLEKIGRIKVLTHKAATSADDWGFISVDRKAHITGKRKDQEVKYFGRATDDLACS